MKELKIDGLISEGWGSYDTFSGALSRFICTKKLFNNKYIKSTNIVFEDIFKLDNFKDLYDDLDDLNSINELVEIFNKYEIEYQTTNVTLYDVNEEEYQVPIIDLDFDIYEKLYFESCDISKKIIQENFKDLFITLKDENINEENYNLIIENDNGTINEFSFKLRFFLNKEENYIDMKEMVLLEYV